MWCPVPRPFLYRISLDGNGMTTVSGDAAGRWSAATLPTVRTGAAPTPHGSWCGRATCVGANAPVRCRFARSSVGPEAAGQLGGTRVGGDRYPIERRNRHDAAHRIREEQAVARERLLAVSALISALHQLEHARPTDAWQNPQVERRGAQRIPIPPEQGPHGAFCYPPLRREEQRVISLRHLGLSARIGEAIPLGGLVGIRLMRLGCGDQGRRSEQRQLAHRHTGPAIAHFETQDGLSSPGERLHQRDDILGRFGKAELAERAPQTSQMPFEERDTPVVYTHGFDETVAGLVHGWASRLLAGLHRQFNPLA